MKRFRTRAPQSVVRGGCCVLLMFGYPVNAHHSSAPFYDRSQVIEVEGEITDVLWQNPHIRFTLRDADSRDWDLEATSVSVMTRWGLSGDVIEVGDRVRVAGSGGIQSDTALWVTNVLLPTGQEVLLSARPRWTDNTLGEDVRGEGHREYGTWALSRLDQCRPSVEQRLPADRIRPGGQGCMGSDRG